MTLFNRGSMCAKYKCMMVKAVSLQRASHMASRTFCTNEFGSCVCVCVLRDRTQRSNGSSAHIQQAVWHTLEGMRGWITLLAATMTFQ